MTGTLPFADRTDAGRQLGAAVRMRALPGPCVVLALPRGGVPVALPVARALGAPLDLVLVRKIGAPWQPELAVAAVVDGPGDGDLVVDHAIRRATGTNTEWIEREAVRQREINARRRATWLHDRPPLPLAGTTTVVVDDGIATGTSIRAALIAVRARGASRVVLAVPVAPASTLRELAPVVDEVVCLATPEPFEAVGCHYRDFTQLEDQDVAAALAQA